MTEEEKEEEKRERTGVLLEVQIPDGSWGAACVIECTRLPFESSCVDDIVVNEMHFTSCTYELLLRRVFIIHISIYIYIHDTLTTTLSLCVPVRS